MKKSLILAGIAALMLSSTMCYAETVKSEEIKPQQPQKMTCENKAKKYEQKRADFDEKLKLTEEQKVKAHEIRMKGHQKMKPVFEQIKAKRQEAEMVKMSRIVKEEQDKKLAVIETEIQSLKQEARKIRMENTKEFEAILTAEQKCEFEKIKKEGKKKYKKHHKNHSKTMPLKK